ncbi:MAG: hypothetical protein HZA14_13090 [Nitrospirae bacterium]|nr:hypothetical protein [Nitrospirota bacterium]
MEDLEWQLEEQRLEQERILEDALEQQRRIAEKTIEKQRLIAEKAVLEHKAIASEAWQLEAQKKAGQASKLYNSGLKEEALSLSLQAISQDPSCAQAYFFAILSFADMGKVTDAGVYAAKAVRLLRIDDYETNIEVHNAILQSILKIGKPENLIEEYEGYIRNNSQKWNLNQLDEILRIYVLAESSELFEISRLLLDEIVTKSIETEDNNVRLNILITLIKISPKTAKQPNELITLHILRALSKKIVESMEASGANTLDKKGNVNIPSALQIFTYDMEIDIRVERSNDGSALEHYLKALDQRCLTDIKQGISNIRNSKIASDEALNAVLKKVEEQYEKVWKLSLAENEANRVMGEKKKLFKLTFLANLGLSLLALIVIVIFIAKDPKGASYGSAQFFTGLLVVLPFVSLLLAVIFYPFLRTIEYIKRRKKAQLAKEKVLALKLEI